MDRLRCSLSLLSLLSLLAPASLAVGQSLSKLPMLQTVRPDQMWLQWETDSNLGGTLHEVDFGVTSVGENTVAASDTLAVDATHFVHRAVLSGLAADTEYVYRVRSGPAVSPEFRFRSAPLPDQPFRVAWLSDNQDQSSVPFLDVLARVVPHQVDWIGHAGDTVQVGSDLSHWQDQWYQPLASSGLGQTTPILVGRGNHDGEGATAYAYHWLPGNERNYAQTIGRVRLIVLDSNNRISEQTTWLEGELSSDASRLASFRIVLFHRPPYTNLWCNAQGYNGEPWGREQWVPLFEQHGVDLVVNGHAHAYERGERNGVTYTIVGGAGGPLDTIVPPETWDHIEVALSQHHYAIMDVDGDRLAWTAYDLQGGVLDAFELRARRAIPALPGAAAAGLAAALALAAALTIARSRAPGGRPRSSWSDPRAAPRPDRA